MEEKLWGTQQPKWTTHCGKGKVKSLAYLFYIRFWIYCQYGGLEVLLGLLQQGIRSLYNCDYKCDLLWTSFLVFIIRISRCGDYLVWWRPNLWLFADDTVLFASLSHEITDDPSRNSPFLRELNIHWSGLKEVYKKHSECDSLVKTMQFNCGVTLLITITSTRKYLDITNTSW